MMNLKSASSTVFFSNYCFYLEEDEKEIKDKMILTKDHIFQVKY